MTVVRGAHGGGTMVSRGVRRVTRFLWTMLLAVVLFWAGLLLLYRFVNPPVTPLMLVRLADHAAIVHRSVPLARVSRDLVRAVVVAEDGRFCSHWGIDLDAVGDALEEAADGGRMRGASTITMQLARNIFLWPGGGFLRKGIEAPLAAALDAAWPKRRILEVYLNVAEWGPGVYGIEAAARTHFGVDARNLSRSQAARLAAILPSPRKWKANPPGAYVASRAATIEARMAYADGYLGCLR
jgi:monofunctional glycosyltransferase